MTHTIWIDVEDLFEYALTRARPSGIQRLSFQLYQALHERDAGAGRVRFVRHAPFAASFRRVEWPEIARAFANLAEGPAPSPVAAPRAPGRLRLLARRRLHALPAQLRLAIIDMALAGIASASALRRLAGAMPRAMLQAGSHLAGQIGQRARRHNSAMAGSAAPGDVILVLGSPWSHPGYAAMIRAYRERHGVGFALLVYDLIPLRRPEWCDAGLTRMFHAWFHTVFPLSDHVFAISRSTAAEVEAYAAERGMTLPRPVITLPMGSATPSMPPGHTARLPPPGSYALIVSTIEARKNHHLLFRVWRRLLDELPREDVPTLVFAGQVGWLVDDLMRQIANTGNLDGKLSVIDSPTDSEVAALYAGCLFTLFPSYHEGWGLPVSESLAAGKPCLISNATSLPEAGGTLVRMFDPDDASQAYDLIRDTILDPAGLAEWEARVRREFRPVPWSVTADALLAGLGVT